MNTQEVITIVSTFNTDKSKGDILPFFAESREEYDSVLKNNPHLKNVSSISFSKKYYDSLRLDVVHSAFEQVKIEWKKAGYPDGECHKNYFIQKITIPE